MDRKCKNCVWWQDYRDRVYARVSGTYGKLHPGRIELRRCKCVLNPKCDTVGSVYTDEEFVCSSWDNGE